MIPEKVWEKIKIEILSQDTIRRNWTLIMNVTDDAALGDRRYRSDTVQSYELYNLTGRETTVLVQHELYSHNTGTDGPGASLATFPRVMVGAEHYHALARQE